MLVIPAIDIIEGKAVRLTKGDYATKKKYFDDPLEVARMVEDGGLTHLHLVDLDGAKGGRPMNLAVLERIASKTGLLVDFGGGIKSKESLESALSAGANEVSLGSISYRSPEIVVSWIGEYRDRLILSADSKGSRIAVQGWLEDTDIDAVEFIRFFSEKGLNKTVATDIEKDGMLSGPSFGLYNRILSIDGVKLIASGGVTTKEDLARLGAMGAYGAIVGKAFYEGTITLGEMKEAEDAL